TASSSRRLNVWEASSIIRCLTSAISTTSIPGSAATMRGKKHVGENQLFLEPPIRRAGAGACYGAFIGVAEQEPSCSRRLPDSAANLSWLGVPWICGRRGVAFESGFNYNSSQRAQGVYVCFHRLALHCGNTGGFLDLHVSR